MQKKTLSLNIFYKLQSGAGQKTTMKFIRILLRVVNFMWKWRKIGMKKKKEKENKILINNFHIHIFCQPLMCIIKYWYYYKCQMIKMNFMTYFTHIYTVFGKESGKIWGWWWKRNEMKLIMDSHKLKYWRRIIFRADLRNLVVL